MPLFAMSASETDGIGRVRSAISQAALYSA